MAEATIDIQLKLVPCEETLAACLMILNLWQDSNPDKFIAMVPDHDKYVYEIVEKEKKDHGQTT